MLQLLIKTNPSPALLGFSEYKNTVKLSYKDVTQHNILSSMSKIDGSNNETFYQSHLSLSAQEYAVTYPKKFVICHGRTYFQPLIYDILTCLSCPCV